MIDLGEAFFYFNPHWWLAAEKQIRGQIPLGISLNSANTGLWIFCSNPAIYVCGNSIAASGAFYLAIGNTAVTAIHDNVLVALVAQTERCHG